MDGCAQRCGCHESFITLAKALGTTFTNVKDNLTLGIPLSHRLHILQGEKIPLALLVALTLPSLHFHCKDSLIFSFPCKQRKTNIILSFYLSFYIVHPTIWKDWWPEKSAGKESSHQRQENLSLFLCACICAATFETFKPHYMIINNNIGKQRVLSSADHQNITSDRIYLRASVNSKQEEFPLFNKSY